MALLHRWADSLAAEVQGGGPPGDPSLGPPPGPTVYPTSGLQQFGFAIILFFPLLAFLVVGLRVYSRLKTKQFGIDDALIVVAMVFSVAETATMYMCMKTNFIGIHVWDVPPVYDMEKAAVWNFAVQVLYNPILALVKTSMLLFLLKLGSQKPGVRWCIHALNALNLMLMVAIFVVVIFECIPVAYSWDKTIPGGHCINQPNFLIATSALTIFTDVLCLALPFWVFLGLKMHLRVKIALLFVFVLGGIVTIIGVVRLVYFYKGFFLPPGPDPFYSLAFCTSAIEINMAIICASAPALRGLFRAWFPRFFSSRDKNYNYYDDRNSDGTPRRGTNNNPYAYGAGGSAATNSSGRRKEQGSVDEDNYNRRSNPLAKDGGGAFALRDLKGGSKTHTTLNSSPTASEEEIMTYNGIVRTTDVLVHYDHESQRQRSAHGERRPDLERGFGGQRRVNQIP
ncbi:uncharacterized protein SPSK_01719 [Sporothrix schenckii 1099-18]|uniref:Rhodopsin domain-containing protein n=2 Tax=Sporothrix schenckii TaxID=29908 RepID=U7PLN4_SPOS1|nr:uncharacterized protein SPSK_01719 [Sporothrix schenckii 1099-18]ERS95395.1 hypothetical protein HMPREF1624_08273 [Sporothrix schenckii ATCC 58251]KJR87484.1 hypothetical protein SPSK_01719 [Sporothrix schenckii 1099-18]